MERNGVNKNNDRDFNIYYMNRLNNIISLLQTIKIESENFIKAYFDINSKCEKLSETLEKQIKKYINFFDKMNTINLPSNKEVLKNKEEKLNEIKKNTQEFYDNILSIFENEYIEKIKKSYNEINDSLNLLSDFEFDPPNINSFNNISSTKENTQSSLGDSRYYNQNISNNHIIEGYNEDDKDYINNNNNNDFEEENDNINIICPTCSPKNRKVICFCEECNQLFCEVCNNIISSNEKEKKLHKMVYINNLKKNKKLSCFLNSINHIIKYILTNFNLILTKKKIKVQNINDFNNQTEINKSNIQYIKRVYDFPYIKQINNLDSIIEFLRDCQKIIDVQIKENKENKIKDEKFCFSFLHVAIKESIKKIFEDPYTKDTKNEINEIDDGFYSNNDDSYSDECYIDEEKYDVKDFIKNINKFYYVINLVAIEKNLYNNNIKTSLKNIISKNLNIQENHIFVSFNRINNFIDTFIKTNEFSDSSLEDIKINYPFYKIYDYKLLYEHIVINDYYKKAYFDYDGNKIDFNSIYKYYEVPYEWFGIGLNVIKIYENRDCLENKGNEWEVAYIGIGQYLSSKHIKEVLINIIEKNALISGKSQNMYIYNESIKGKNVYVTPSISLVEKYSGIISINNKKYKIALMAKVLRDKIKKVPNIKFWILNKEDIRIYRILLKEISN